MSDSQSPATCCQSGEAPGRVTRSSFPTRPRTESRSFFRRPQDRSHQVAQRPNLQSQVEPNLRQKAGSLLGVLRDASGRGSCSKPSLLYYTRVGVCMRAHVCTCVCASMSVHTHFTPGAPPRRAGGEVTSASHCNCRSSGGGRTPGRGCPSGPTRGGGQWEGYGQEREPGGAGGCAGAGWASLSCPSRTHLLKAGVPLLRGDHKLDPLTHVVLKLPGGGCEEAENRRPVS